MDDGSTYLLNEYDNAEGDLAPVRWQEWCPAPTGIHFTDEQQRAIHTAARGLNVFLTGAAGTGKSLVLRHIVRVLKMQHGREKVYVTASTGCAARHVGGVTIHTALNLGTMPDRECVKTSLARIVSKPNSYEKWSRLSAIVIDEVSMLSSVFWDKLDTLARAIRSNIHTPWGGIQVIAVGDFLQLGPVGAQARWAFQGTFWKLTKFRNCLLTKVHRQASSSLVDRLGELREGRITEEVLAFVEANEVDTADATSTVLMSHNVGVDKVNTSKLLALGKTRKLHRYVEYVEGKAACCSLYCRCEDILVQVQTRQADHTGTTCKS